jgi:hypothetical protein
MSTTYQLTVTYTQGQEIVSDWHFNDQAKPTCCQVQKGDKIAFRFEGPGDIAECVLLAGAQKSGQGSSPFNEGNRINLKGNSTLNVGNADGLWCFSIAFTARNGDATTSFYYLPDPEVQVGSH